VLKGQVADLQRRLAKNSRNSSLPPSRDGLSKPPVEKPKPDPKSLRRRSGRKPGGQPGHDGGHLAQVAVPDEVVDHVPAVCDGCHGDLRDGTDLGYRSRQVFDLPEIRLGVCEHRAHRRLCGCGHETTGEFPLAAGAATQYGPRVRALGIYLVAYQHLPYGRAAQLLSDWIGAPLSTGTLVGFIARGAEDLGGFLQVIHDQITRSPVAHFDETGARAQGRLHWLFCSSTDRATYYSIHRSRGRPGMEHAGILENFTGTAVHDGWAPYRRYTAARHALCNAHHLRELLGVIEDPADPSQSWATQMDALLRALQITVQNAKADQQDHLDPLVLGGYRAAYAQIIATGHRQSPPRLTKTGKRGVIKQTPARNLLLRLDRYREDVLRFAHDLHVPFDNNPAERDIRMIKLQQKISGAWRTLTGAEHFLAIRAYLSTTRKNNLPTMPALTALANHTPWHPT
jgi:transposase